MASVVNAIRSGALPKVGVIICSQRSPRIGDQVGTFVYKALQKNQQTKQQSSSTTPRYELSLIDLADHALPFFSEPIIPQAITDPAGYHHEHTRNWSKFISSYSAFIFVTPQYNWSIPGNLKNAIDYLFNEWVGKPAMIVSYGGHGGGKAAEHLSQVLTAIKMRVVEKSVGLAYPTMGEDGRAFTKKALGGKELGLGQQQEDGELVWAEEMEDVVQNFEELVGMLPSKQA